MKQERPPRTFTAANVPHARFELQLFRRTARRRQAMPRKLLRNFRQNFLSVLSVGLEILWTSSELTTRSSIGRSGSLRIHLYMSNIGWFHASRIDS